MKNKKSFYFIRHGQTDANANGLMCGGEWDIPLNERGENQSLKIQNKVASILPAPTLLCVSPMIRTQQTATNINKRLAAPTITIEGLREWCVGDWDKEPWEKVPNPFETNQDPTNGERKSDFEQRVITTVDRALTEHQSECILFVSHGAFAHMLFSHLGIDQLQIENCVIYKVMWIDSNWTIQKV